MPRGNVWGAWLLTAGYESAGNMCDTARNRVAFVVGGGTV